MGSNINGKAYALTVLSPIRAGVVPGQEIAFADKVRDTLQNWNLLTNSPMTLVPQTYLCRYFVLDDVYTQSLPSGSALDTLNDFLPIVPDFIRKWAMPTEDHLQSRYLVFSCNFHGGANGDVDKYLQGMWNAISDRIREVWGYCYGFERVKDAASFAAYIKQCQFTSSLFFVGSNDDPLPEQLKALYLKQEFARFAVENQGLEPAVVRANYFAFTQRVKPTDLSGPAWTPGQYRL